MSEGMFGSRDVAPKGIADTGNVDSETGSNDSGVQPEKPQFNEDAIRKSVQERLSKQAKKHAAEKAELEARLAAYEGGTPADDDEKPAPKQTSNADAEYRRKLARADKDMAILKERLDRQRQNTLKATVSQKLTEKDCIDPDLAYGDLAAKGFIKLDDEDNIVVDPLYENLDKLLDDYLGKRDYLRVSKAVNGLGSKAPGISSNATSEVQNIINQVRSVQSGQKLMFGKR